MSILATAALVGSLVASVSAHGRVTGAVVDGVYYDGYNPSYQYSNPPPVVIGWSDPLDLGNGFVGPNAYTSPDIICHLGATPAGTSAPIAAGGVVSLQWTAWPSSHRGPVIDYLAKCPGDCSTVDKTTLKFFKIDGVGLITGGNPGVFGSDQLIANNNSWSVTIPKTVAPGNYVLRHEIIGLHVAGSANGAQNYPQCFNLKVSGSGTDNPAGTLATAFYTPTDPGILFNLYTTITSYIVPGPALYSGAVAAVQSVVPVVATAPTSAAAAPAAPPAASSVYVAPSSAAAAPVASSAAAAPVASSAPAVYMPPASAVSTPPASAPAPPASSAAAPVSASSAAPVASQCTQYITITGSAPASVAPTSSVAVAPVTASSSAAAVVASSAPVKAVYTSSAKAPPALTSTLAPIASILSGLSSGALTKTLATSVVLATPTASAAAGGYSAPGVGQPSKALPPGWTLQDLLDWVTYLATKFWKSGNQHARSFRV